MITQGVELIDNTSEMLKFNVEEKPLLGFWAVADGKGVQSLGPVIVNIVDKGCKTEVIEEEY